MPPPATILELPMEDLDLDHVHCWKSDLCERNYKI